MAKTTAKTYWRNYYLVDGEICGGMDRENLADANWYSNNAIHKALYRIKITMKDNPNELQHRPKQPPKDRRSVWQ